MKILHITDFHFGAESSLQQKVVDSIIITLKENKEKIDFIFFTGDLVNNGTIKSDFQKAKTILFDRLSSELCIDKTNVIFCAGNHDIDRDSIHGAMKAYFDTSINNNDKLNEFYKRKTEALFIDSVKPSGNFNKFLADYHIDSDENSIKDLYSIHFRKFNDQKIGIVCLNSAWLSSLDKEKSVKEDRGNLLIPKVLLAEIKKELTTVQRKIILIHHPLYFLKEFNLYEVESFIHNEFEMLFSGHVHKISSLARHSGSNGIFEHVAKASLSSKNNLGCSIVDIDEIEENKITVKEVTYIYDSDKCFIDTGIEHRIPVGPEKSEIIAFRKKLFDKISIEKENANNLLLVNEEADSPDFLELYNHPVLKKEAEAGLSIKLSSTISLEDLSSGKSNYLVFGKDKCGKTSLLRRIQLDCLINHSKNGKIPFYFDSREFESKVDSNFDINQLIRQYFEISKAKVEHILKTGDFIFLIDNFTSNSAIGTYLIEYFNQSKNLSFIICSEYSMTSSVDIYNFGSISFEKLYFHDLRRTEIISYTEKRLASNHNKELIQDKIVQLCKQLELPLNYWTISLLLLIHSKSTDSYSKNMFSILDVVIDEIFNKKQLLLSRSRITFDQIKRICAELAKGLFNDHKKTTFSAPTHYFLSEIERIIFENDRISANSKDVFEYLVLCSVLKQKNDSDYYVFRLNGFFEYFLAYQMTRDEQFKKEIFDNEVNFLAFKNQLEMYSGFKRSDSKFLLAIYKKCKNKLLPVLGKYSSNKDEALSLKIETSLQLKDFCKQNVVNTALSSEKRATIEDINDELKVNADVHEMAVFNPNKINSDLVERYLSILARVYKNTDDISDEEDKVAVAKLFDYVLERYCDFGFYIIDEFSDQTKREVEKDNDVFIEDIPEYKLLSLISNFSPLICQTCLFDGIGHYNMEKLIKEKIEFYEQDHKNNQFKLFMLYFLLLDIDLIANKEYIDRALKNLIMPPLKYSIVIKLNYYLAFKSGGKAQLQSELATKIQTAQLNLDGKSNLGEIHKQIQEKKRISNSKKQNS